MILQEQATRSRKRQFAGGDKAFRLNARKFRWRTMQGDVLTLAQMETSHLFNSLKMIFNHIAAAYGGVPVWFTKTYHAYESRARRDPKGLAYEAAIFAWEIDRRGDLPEKYQRAYADILGQILGIQRLREDALQLPSPPETQRERDLREQGFHVDFMGMVEANAPGLRSQEIPNFGVIDDDFDDPDGWC